MDREALSLVQCGKPHHGDVLPVFSTPHHHLQEQSLLSLLHQLSSMDGDSAEDCGEAAGQTQQRLAETGAREEYVAYQVRQKANSLQCICML